MCSVFHGVVLYRYLMCSVINGGVVQAFGMFSH